MKVLIQRVNSASVSVHNEIVGSIGQGLLLFVGIGKSDNSTTLNAMAEKIKNLRIFSDEDGRFQFSLIQTKGSVLLVPQFTLFADTRKGRRPEFFDAMPPKEATTLFDEFTSLFTETSALKKVATGEFGANMQVKLENDGPVTLMLEL